MSADDKKDLSTLKTELYKEFKKEQRNREEAVCELTKRKRSPGESIPTFAYNLLELVKMAYPEFDDNHRGIIGKYHFVNGLTHNMQVWLRSTARFANKTFKEITELASSLEIAGVKEDVKTEIHNVSDEIAEKGVEKLNINGHSREELGESSIHGKEVAINFYWSRGRGGARNRDGGNRGRFIRNTEIRNYTTK